MSKVNWHKGKPTESGTHFVAVKYVEGAGTFDFIEWDGKKWNTEFDGTVIAYLTLEELIKNIPFEWPENCEIVPKSTSPKSGKAESSWEEM